MVNMQAITVRLPEDLYEWLRQYAFDGRVSQAAVVVAAITEYRDNRTEATA
jgi:predicted transcriptional regulator